MESSRSPLPGEVVKIPKEAVDAALGEWAHWPLRVGLVKRMLKAAAPYIAAQTLKEASEAYPLETAYGGAEHAVMWLQERAIETTAVIVCADPVPCPGTGYWKCLRCNHPIREHKQ